MAPITTAVEFAFNPIDATNIAKIRYVDIEAIGFANVLSSKDFIKIDTIPVATIKWNLKLTDSIINPKETELRAWLQKEMELDTLFIKREK
jgi:hypothetical protein